MSVPTPRDARALLPLTEQRADVAFSPLADESVIRTLVDTFYTKVRDDALLGPIFARHVADWSKHLPKMYDFWSTVVLHTGRYAGRPLDAHLRLGGLRQAHFDRWVELWTATVHAVLPIPARAAFTIPAERMARSMAYRILNDPSGNL